MQKRVIEREPAIGLSNAEWLDIESLVTVEITSEEPNRPIELAFRGGGEAGWRAAAPSVQVIRLLFHQPQRIARIRLRFAEIAWNERRSLCCAGRRARGNLSRRLFASNGTSVRRVRISSYTTTAWT